MEHGRSAATMNDNQISDYLIQNEHDRNFINVRQILSASSKQWIISH